ncbi:hypothetical protein TCAL_11264 [Tigriopus californicus]|uniref:lysoplasmalogenase n=1 Tax=Tigriopus californicus TaxID=6832 RepID=A0A553P3S0_TIGCA|nr:lysoplasmalogenase-like [Tigriopus californicus]TRY72300.1 hypothetical protein TCAL_11264 [Tigriopus californicus]|eukprot:TCALIF_11264-PA protein Name:"Similar to TMEM86B Lysoplasmalogenase (Sus scrofa)" AED:0.02 eAED:0.02 QI:0/-1/0/1/-1/1/1/0/227
MWAHEFNRLLPFLTCQFLYWGPLYFSNTKPSLSALLVKCLPILSLILYILLRSWPKKESKFIRRILIGLAFSMVGDACLVYRDIFVLGMMAFGIAHFSYIAAFGWEDTKYSIALVVFVIGYAPLFGLILPSISDPVLKCGIPIYALLLLTMCWRALARAQTWIGILTGLGAVLFVISDFVIVWNDFYQPVENQQLIIMSTYYGAQLLITLSASEIFVKCDDIHQHSQ